MASSPAEPADGKAVDRSLTASLGRISRTLLIGLVIAGSLLSFPSVLPWMLVIWLVWHTALVVRWRPAYLPLLACLLIMIAKLVPRTPIMLMFALVLVLVALVRWRAARQDRLSRPSLRWMTLVLWIAWSLVVYDWHRITNSSRQIVLDPQRPVVCLGDSLTQGMLPDRGYPDQLKEMIAVPVINSGFSGIATSQALGQLTRVLQHNPQVVVIELGGHDFLKGHRRAATKRNLSQMIKQCRDAGAEVILMEIPRGFMFDPYASLEREIAHEQDVQLVPDSAIRQLVFWSPIAPPGMWFPDAQLSDDGIHSNRRGSKAMAVYVRDALQRMYGDQILR